MKIFFGFGRGATGTIVSLAQQVEEIAKEMAQVTRFLAIAA